jgi:zinc transporter 9
MGIILVRMNHRFLLGQSVDKDIIDDINKILLSRRSIDSIGSVQSQWTGPDTFSYKAEVDFDGTYLAAILMKFYQQEFMKIKDTMEDELQGMCYC